MMEAPELPPARVLLVDDNPANLLALEAILAPLDAVLVRASSGAEALRRLLEPGDFALILMDVHMPELDGFETAALIKERLRSAEVPIIFVTALGETAQVQTGYSRGAVDFITKPFDAAILRSKVAVFIDLFQRGERIKAQAQLLAEREREAAERRHAERFLRLVESMPLAIFSTDREGRPVQFNRAFANQFDVRAFRGFPLVDPAVVHPEDLSRAVEAWDACCKDAAQFEIELRLRSRGDGSWRWHLVRVVENFDDHGGWLATLVDIDRRKRAEHAAQAANRAKDEFLAIVSHELRTPLTAIIGWTHLLRRRQGDPEKFERALEMLERNARVQAELIDDILDVSRITSGKLRLHNASMDLGAACEAAVETVRHAAVAKGIALEVEVDPAARPFVGDPERIQQIVWNLLSNAIKFSHEGANVRLRLGVKNGFAEIEVSDQGEGIASEFLPFVFERFRQEDAGTTRAHGGLGLGLAIVKHLVEAHGGTVEAKSGGRGRGATFLVRLPRRVDVALAAPIEQGPANALDLRDMDVLFVDDQPDAREAIGEILREHGAHVRVAGSVAEALEQVADAPPDVLVSDIGMPHEDGFSLIRRLRALPPEKGGTIPAIAMTGFARDDDARRSIEEGFQAHLRKPVEPARLVETLAELAGSPDTH